MELNHLKYGQGWWQLQVPTAISQQLYGTPSASLCVLTLFIWVLHLALTYHVPGLVGLLVPHPPLVDYAVFLKYEPRTAYPRITWEGSKKMCTLNPTPALNNLHLTICI